MNQIILLARNGIKNEHQDVLFFFFFCFEIFENCYELPLANKTFHNLKIFQVFVFKAIGKDELFIIINK